MQELAKVLDPNELHIINVLTNTQLKIQCGNEKSDAFETDTGVPQSDWTSLHFILQKHWTAANTTIMITAAP